jgi:phosphotransferase system enzyme I (PtsP)
VKQAHELGKPISICGEMAGDPSSAILLMAMGFNALSMSASNILRVRKTLCHVPMSDAKTLLDDVLNMDNPLVIRSWIEHYLLKHNLADMAKSATLSVKA